MDHIVSKKTRNDFKELSIRVSQNFDVSAKYKVLESCGMEHSVMYGHLLRKTYLPSMFIADKVRRVVCRFGCSSPPSLPYNTLFSSNFCELVALGYRECERCKPLSYRTPKHLSAYAEGIESSPFPDKEPVYPMSELAKWLLSNCGVDLQQYIQIKRVNFILQQGVQSIHSSQILYHRLKTPLGQMLACFFGGRLCLLMFMDDPILEEELLKLSQREKVGYKVASEQHVRELVRQLKQYFDGKRRDFSIPLQLTGSSFQRSVWEDLSKLKHGETSTYKSQAQQLGKPGATRALANAIAMNRVSILVPCHRVMGQNGTLTGYGGGIHRKQYLLNSEVIPSLEMGGEL